VHFGEAVLHHARELLDLGFVLHAFIVPGSALFANRLRLVYWNSAACEGG
jgi:hypothetical protein